MSISSTTSSHFSTKGSPLPLATLYKSLAFSSLVLFFFYVLLFNPLDYQPSNILAAFKQRWPAFNPTNISHIVFGIVGSVDTWKQKRPYIEAWWQPNVTRGYLFLDRVPTGELIPWPSTDPPFRVNENITNHRAYTKINDTVQLRIVRRVLETFRAGDKDVRWYVMADDDTVLVIYNLVAILSKYDHTKYLYIGMNSECVKSNFDFSFDMAFGGAGYALSYPLMEALAPKLDECTERYAHLRSSDYILSACLSDFGIPLTQEKGFHQIDLHGDISGLLSAQQQNPFISLHHIDTVYSIFPSKSRSDSINHLMTAAKSDHSRILQQTICYHRPSNWSFSISWGYSAHVYESVYPRSFLQRPIETFRPWARSSRPFFMFNTRWISGDPCETPHVFFFDSVDSLDSGDQIITTYLRRSARHLPACSSSDNHSADPITRIKVFSPSKAPLQVGESDCCDVAYKDGTNIAEVKYRTCIKNELIA